MDQFWAGFAWGIVSTLVVLIFGCILLGVLYGVRNSKTHSNGLVSDENLPEVYKFSKSYKQPDNSA